MKAQASKVRLVTDEAGGAELIFSLSRENLPQIRKGISELKQWIEKGKTIDIDVKEHREKRSIDANAYMWKLLEKMSEKLPESKDELYDKMLIEYGVFETVSVRKEAAEAFIRQWKGPVKRLGSGVVNGKEFEHLRVCFGSSGYDTKQMARLLDGIIRECKELGIDTKTPAEIADIMSLTEGL